MENSILDNIPRLPVSDWISSVIDWLTINLSWLFGAIQDGGSDSMNFVTDMLLLIPPIVFILINWRMREKYCWNGIVVQI